MNIQQAKEQIKYAIKSYFAKDESGEYIIPIERQRPVILMGPPGIGKTAVMEQIASELGVGLVTYSMTHHTRQSALGLPFIVQRDYGGKTYSVSEYTMSEIIASVYNCIENDGAKEGILFLDEINCVSETLAPSMLQFLQYKVFGAHRVPDGWIVVTAGNPPEYNNSVREFDIVTWDRFKRIDVEPDFEVWKSYALSRGVHPAIITFLEIKKDFFYSVKTTVDGKRFVTARGWVDLNDMIRLYEKNGFKVDQSLAIQYLQDPRIAGEFAVYYDLFSKYRSDYRLEKILDGEAPPEITKRAANARFDERLAVVALLFDAVRMSVKSIAATEKMLSVLVNCVKLNSIKMLSGGTETLIAVLKDRSCQLTEDTRKAKRSGRMSGEDTKAGFAAAAMLMEIAADVQTQNPTDVKAAFGIIKKRYEYHGAALKKTADQIKTQLNNALLFCEKAFGSGNEIVILVTELTADQVCAHFIARYGCEQYYRFSKELLISERQHELIQEISCMDLDNYLSVPRAHPDCI